MIPEGWKIMTLGQICEGDLQTGPFGSQLHASDYSDQGVAVVMPKDIVGCKINLESAARVPKEKALGLKKHILKRGDIVFSRRGDVTKFAVVDEVGEGSLCGTGCLRARLSKNHSINFISFFIQKDSVRRWLEGNAVGQTMPNMNTSILSELPLVAAQSCEEEERIGNVLATWDKAMANTESLIEVSRQQFVALSYQLLTGGQRLPGFGSKWRLVRLGDVARRVIEKNNGQSDNVVTISGKRGLVRQTDFFNKSVASEALDGYTILRKGQFAYNKSYSDGYPMGAIKRLNLYDDAVVTSLYICFEVHPADACEEFMEHYFESGVLNRGLKKVAAEGGRAHGLLNVKPSDFFDLRLSLPPKEEQKAIAKVLSHADAEIEALQRRLECLRQEKKALMQELLTGKRRVKVRDEAA